MDVPSGRHSDGGAAKRRRLRRLRSWWRHELLTVAAVLATYQHHSAPRGQGEEREKNYTAALPKMPPSSSSPGGTRGSATSLCSTPWCRSLGTSWWKCRLSSSSSTLPSRTLTFQYVVVSGIVEIGRLGSSLTLLTSTDQRAHGHGGSALVRRSSAGVHSDE